VWAVEDKSPSRAGMDKRQPTTLESWRRYSCTLQRSRASRLIASHVASVRPMAERVGNSIHSTIPQAAREFLEEQLIVVVGLAGTDGRVWASLLVGEPGSVRVLGERTVRIDATPLLGDPLEKNQVGKEEKEEVSCRSLLFLGGVGG
jgi:predicted pyridoxine 5'-phosphate oxidase superfamily flavin-nucleotide-binding protein